MLLLNDCVSNCIAARYERLFLKKFYFLGTLVGAFFYVLIVYVKN